MASFDMAGARSRFPALNQEQVFMDNAGKSLAAGSIKPR
jgi:selenocysteine lyase/cysteine desulfurase